MTATTLFSDYANQLEHYISGRRPGNSEKHLPRVPPKSAQIRRTKNIQCVPKITESETEKEH